ncbi:MAG: hypothetical protein PHH13_01925 [Candidatus Peribacteraceae bacterium]|nr:hypothetical protein [Candidatus Peribacteraceae bacterium]
MDEYLRAVHACEPGVRSPIEIAGMSSGITGLNMVLAATRRRMSVIFGGTAIGYVEHEKQIQAQSSQESRVKCYQDGNVETMLRVAAEAREQRPFGIIGANFLAAAPDSMKLIEAVCKQGKINEIVVGAGILRKLPELMARYPKIYYTVISSSMRVTDLLWGLGGENGRKPSRCYYESPVGLFQGEGAGGHIGARDKWEGMGRPRPVPTSEELQALGSSIDWGAVLMQIRKDQEHFDPHKYDPERFLEEFKTLHPRTPLGFGGGVDFKRDIDLLLAMGYDYAAIGSVALLSRASGMPLHLKEECYLDRSGRYAVEVVDSSPSGITSRRLRTPEDERRPVTEEIAERTRGQCVKCIGERCRFNRPGGENQYYCIKEHLIATQKGERGGVMFVGSVQRIRDDSNFEQVYVDEQGNPRSPEFDTSIDYHVLGKLPVKKGSQQLEFAPKD